MKSKINSNELLWLERRRHVDIRYFPQRSDAQSVPGAATRQQVLIVNIATEVSRGNRLASWRSAFKAIFERLMRKEWNVSVELNRDGIRLERRNAHIVATIIQRPHFHNSTTAEATP